MSTVKRPPKYFAAANDTHVILADRRARTPDRAQSPAAARSVGRFDLDVDRRHDVRVQSDQQVDASELFQRLVEVDLAPVDVGTGLLLDGFGDVVGSHRAEQPSFAARTRLDRDRATR